MLAETSFSKLRSPNFGERFLKHMIKNPEHCRFWAALPEAFRSQTTNQLDFAFEAVQTVFSMKVTPDMDGQRAMEILKAINEPFNNALQEAIEEEKKKDAEDERLLKEMQELDVEDDEDVDVGLDDVDMEEKEN